MRITILFIAVLGITLQACTSYDDRQMNQLEGHWDIVHSERIQINQDGSTEIFEDLEDAGYLEIYSETSGLDGLKDVIMEYTNFNGDRISYQGTIYNDDTNERVLFAGFFCNSIFNCDLGWNVDHDGRRKQVWSFYYTPTGGRNQYDPTAHNVHYKWTITLRK